MKIKYQSGIASIMFCLLTISAPATVLLTEEYPAAYGDGTRLGTDQTLGGYNTKWPNGNSTGTGSPTNTSAGALTYAPLQPISGVASYGMQISTATSRNTIAPFTSQSGDGNSVYWSFLIKVTATTPTARQIGGFRNSTGTGNLSLGVGISATRQLTLYKNSAVAATHGTTLTVGTTYFVVARYKFLSGSDEVALWLNPATGNASEPTIAAPDVSSTTGTDQSSALSLQLLSAADTSGALYLDEHRVTTTWAEATPSFCSPPTTYGMSGGGTICAGDAGPSVGLTNSDTGVDYQLKRNGSNVGSPLPGNGSPLDFGPQATAGTYTIVGSNTTTTCTGSMLGNAVVTVNTSPVLTTDLTNKTVFLGGTTSFSVGASGAGLSYQWRRDGTNLSNAGNISGATTATLTLNPVAATDGVGAGNGYEVVIVGSCSPATNSSKVSLTVVPPADLVWTGDGGANVWDLATTANFLNGASPSQFNTGDNVIFDNPATNPIVTLSGTLSPTLLLVKSSADYGFIGSGLIGGTGSLVKSNTGTLTIANSSANTFSGKTTIAGGTVSIAADTAFGNAPATAVADQLTLNGGSLAMTNNVTLAANRGLTLGAGGGTISVATGATNTYNGIIAGVGGLTKTGNGVLALQNPANSYTGNTTISAGTISVDGDAILGTAAGTVFLSGGRLTITADRQASPTAAPIGNPIQMTADSELTTTSTASEARMVLTNDVFTASAGTLTLRNDGADASSDVFTVRHYGGGFTFARPIVFAAGNLGSVSTFRSYNGAGDQIFTGVISGGGAWHRRSSVAGTSGNTVFSGDNTFTGGVTLSDGGIGLGISSTGSPVTSGPLGTGTFSIVSTTGASNRLYAVGGARTVGNTINWAGQPLVLGGANDLTLSGAIDLNGGTRTLIISNTAASTLSGIVSNGSLTIVGPGALTFNGSSLGLGTTTVSSGTLSGTGAFLGPVSVSAGGNLAPGSSIGTLAISNSLALTGTMTVEVSRNGATLTCDRIVGLTNVTFGGTLVVTDIGPDPLQLGNSFQLFNLAGTGSFTISGSPGGGNVWSFDPTTGALTVAAPGSGAAPPLNFSQIGNSLQFSWANALYKLQAQTNSLGTGLVTNNSAWFDYPGGGSSPVTAPIDTTQGCVFFRLFKP